MSGAALDLWFWAGVAVVAVALLALAAVNMANGDRE